MSPNQNAATPNATSFHFSLSHFCFFAVLVFFSQFAAAQPVPAALANPQPSAQPSPTKQPSAADLTTLSERHVATIAWRADLTHAVFYRLADDRAAVPVRVFIAGAYHATLMPGTFTELCLPAGNYVIHLGGSQSINSVDFSQSTDLVPRQSHFFRVHQKTGETAQFLETSPEQAFQEASPLNRVRTLTRVSRSQDCRPPA